MSRRNNIKMLGLPENKKEKTWDDTENLVKQTRTHLKLTMKFKSNVPIAWGNPAHCLGKEKMEQK